MSIVHILIKRYYDGNGFFILGATEKDEVAQAFCMGGGDSDCATESYDVETEAPVLSKQCSVKPTDWEAE